MRAKRPIKIIQRISAVTNSFVQSVLPSVALSVVELSELRRLLNQGDDGDWRCVYCDDRATEWDHLFALVADRRPTGHLNAFGNLVPACGTCNHSKGSKDWQAWITGTARFSPARRAIVGIPERIAMLQHYTSHYAGKTDMTSLYDPDEYEAYWKKLAEIEVLMREAQQLADLMAMKALVS